MSNTKTNQIYNQLDCACTPIVSLTEKKSLIDLSSELITSLSLILKNATAEIFKNKLPDNYDSKNTCLFNVAFDDENQINIIISRQITSDEKIQVEQLLSVFKNLYGHLSSIGIDRLTGLWNRQLLDSRLDSYFNSNDKKSRKKDVTPSFLAIIDIDHFKQVNDKFGHLYGDEVLLLLSQIMKSSFRDNDYIFRYGGEEFICILEDLKLEHCRNVLDRFSEKVRTYQFPQVGKVTLSIGFTKMDRQFNAATVIGSADSALYYAKKNGRDCTHHFESLLAEGKLSRTELNTDDITIF